MFRSKKQEIEDRVAKLTEEIKGLQPEKEQTSNEDYSVKLLELRERLKEYTGFDYSVIPESIVRHSLSAFGCQRMSSVGI